MAKKKKSVSVDSLKTKYLKVMAAILITAVFCFLLTFSIAYISLFLFHSLESVFFPFVIALLFLGYISFRMIDDNLTGKISYVFLSMILGSIPLFFAFYFAFIAFLAFVWK